MAEFDFWQIKGIFHFPNGQGRFWTLLAVLFNWHRGLFPMKADHLPRSSVEVNNELSYASPVITG